MKLRTTLLIGIITLIASIVGAVMAAIYVVIDGEAVRREHRELEASWARFEQLHRIRGSLFDSKNRIIADEPRLKAVLATAEVSPETVFGVAGDLQTAIRCDLFVVTDAAGTIITDTSDPDAAGADLSQNAEIIEALKNGISSGVWSDGQSAFQVNARRVSLDQRTLGVSVIGYRIDDGVADAARSMSDSIFAIARGGDLLAISTLPEWMTLDRRALAEAMPALAASPESQAEIGGEKFLALAERLPGSKDKDALTFVVARSLDRALQPAQQLLAVLCTIALVLVLISAGLAVTFAEKLSRPLDELVAFTRRVAAGDLGARTEARGVVEVKTLGRAMNLMAAELEENRKEALSRVEKEMEIAAKIQTSILPREARLENAEIATRMIPASEVGGDYYDLLSGSGGGWIGIGDVTGHGVPAGMVMLMLQSSIAALASDGRVEGPSELLVRLNALMFDSIRHRLSLDDHVTLNLIRYFRDGRLCYAGAHEVMLIHRARAGRCERIAPEGTWIGAIPDISEHTKDASVKLESGDLLILYTDGITEAMNERREQFGLDRLCNTIESVSARPVQEICDHVVHTVSTWMSRQEDDLSLVVLRYRGESSWS